MYLLPPVFEDNLAVDFFVVFLWPTPFLALLTHFWVPRRLCPVMLKEFSRASLVLVVQQSHSCFLASGTMCPCRWRGNICFSGCYLIFSYVRNNCLTDYELSSSSTLSGLSMQLNVNDSNENIPSTSWLSVRINYAGDLYVGVLILCCVLPVFAQAKHHCRRPSFWRNAGVFSM